MARYYGEDWLPPHGRWMRMGALPTEIFSLGGGGRGGGRGGGGGGGDYSRGTVYVVVSALRSGGPHHPLGG
jgi:hypothetical protein